MTDLLEPTDTVPARAAVIDEPARAGLFLDARTANAFAPTPVSDAELEHIWELTRWAPTAANFQPLRVQYVRTPAGRARLVEHMNEGNRAKTLGAPAAAVLAYDSRFYEHIPTVMPPMAHLRDVFAADAEGAQQAASFNAALQAGYFVLAVRAVGLVAGPMAGFDAAAVDADFFADGRWKSFLVVNIGHAGENAYRPRQPRLEAAEVVRWA